MRALTVVFILACAPQTLIDFGLARWRTEPQVRMEDAYKWVYQATRGGEHAVPDEKMARDWLDQELRTLGPPEAGEPLWEPLCPGGEIVRLNLRPFRARGGRADDLLAAFVRSSREFYGAESDFIAAWTKLGNRLRKRSYGRLTRRSWLMLDRKMRAAGYPAIHHSKVYEQLRRPAYRVLTGNEARKLTSELRK